MTSDAFLFAPLTPDTLADWMQVASTCTYAPANVLDEPLMRERAQHAATNLNIVIYTQGTQQPIAAFPGQLDVWKKGWWPVRVLESRFGGLLIAEHAMAQAQAIKAYMFRAVVSDYYRWRCRIDYLDVHLPPKLVIARPEWVDRVLPFQSSHVRVNSLLYTQLSDDLLGRLDYNVRRETLKGLRALETCRVVRQNDPQALEHLMRLEAAKTAALQIQPVSRDHFSRVLASPTHHTSVVVMDQQPQAAVIASCGNGIATFHYNASTRDAKRSYLNKALLYQVMQECRARGASYFVLGNSNEDDGFGRAGRRNGHSNIPNVRFFKRSFSTDEIAWYRFLYPLSYTGQLVITIAQWNSLPQRQNAEAEVCAP